MNQQPLSKYQQHYQTINRDHTDTLHRHMHTAFQDRDKKYTLSLTKNTKFSDVGKRALNNQLPKIGHYEKQTLNPEIQSIQIPSYPKNLFKFEGSSQYQQSFKDSVLMKKIRQLNSEKINRKGQMHHNEHSFYGYSSYRHDYKPFRVQTVRDQRIKNDSIHIPFARNNQKSTYQSDFKDIKIVVQLERNCPARYQCSPKQQCINHKNKIDYYRKNYDTFNS